MAGRILADDVAAVKERTAIDDVVREHVTLRAAGPGMLKGLCPFHDEKTPSFTVRPATGTYKCFGCDEGGDAISFVQKLDHLTFTEAVERLASRLGMELRYEEGGQSRRDDGGPKRSRLVDAHRVAEAFYAQALIDRQDARVGRDFLRSRGFDGDSARHFGVGFAPRGGEELVRHLTSQGFSDAELVASGLVGRGSRGLYDRFRGRVVWPIRDITGDTVGFGARRLLDDDPIQAKYLNTSETAIYKKSTVLYGLDLAKKSIAAERRAVVVEGYTDVMAAHIAGVEGAVASCGTAFGVDHIKVLRRILRDEPDLAPARVVFTFDGDAAGQSAAMKAFKEDQRWASQSYVAVAADGMDPCDLRLARGDQAVRDLVDGAVPMFEFAVRTTIARFDLTNAEGRVQAMRAAAPIVHDIRDSALRPEYTRTVAGWLGVEVDQMRSAVNAAGRQAATRPATTTSSHDAEPTVPEPSGAELAAAYPAPDLRDPVVSAERQLLQALLQYPSLFPARAIDDLSAAAFSAPAHRVVFEAMIGAGGLDPSRSLKAWTAAVRLAAPATVQSLVEELTVAQLPTHLDRSTGAPPMRYAVSLLARVREVSVARQIADGMSAMTRLSNDPSADPSEVRAVSERLQRLQHELVQLRAEAQ